MDNAYFQTLGLRVNQGRDFNRSDGQPGTEVAIVNQPFASQYWPGESAVGKRLQLGNAASPWLTIVGVSPAVYQSGTVQRTPAPLVYVPFRESPVAEFSLLMRSPEGPTAAISLLRSELAGLDSDLPLFDITTVDEYLRSDMWPQRVIGTLFGAFAIAALLMSATGLYGVTAYGVVQRKQEFGIRMALGATSTNVVGLVLWQSLKPMVAGLSLGLIGATLVSGLLTVLLFGVSPTDPVAFVSAGAVLLAVTLTACLVPARRATRLDPLNALRAE